MEFERRSDGGARGRLGAAFWDRARSGSFSMAEIKRQTEVGRCSRRRPPGAVFDVWLEMKDGVAELVVADAGISPKFLDQL